MKDLERREPEKNRNKHLIWALGLSILALGAALVPAGGPLFLALAVVFAISATASLAKGLDTHLKHQAHHHLSAGAEHAALPSVSKEREILQVLRDRITTTPMQAAMETSLSVREADEILSELAGGGHLAVESQAGVLYYSIPGHDGQGLQGRG